jgi:acyl dehydratase
MIHIYFEDFVVGEKLTLGERTISKAEVLDFARQFDPQPFHVDDQAAEKSIYGGLIASGWHTCALAMRMMCDSYLLEAASMGSPGIDELRWLKPVRPGDTIRGEREILESRPSRSKPDRGIVRFDWRIYNQHDELVMTMKGMGLFLRRPTSTTQKISGED